MFVVDGNYQGCRELTFALAIGFLVYISHSHSL